VLLAADLVRRGYAVWNLEYRRAGAAGGWPATFEDIAAAARAGGRAWLHETGGDHFTLIDPHSADWRVAADALPGLLGLPGGHLGADDGEAGNHAAGAGG
jgi:hypothetical protein